MSTPMVVDAALHRWLAEEVWELFQAGGVGLYEFTELLNGPDRPSSAQGLTTVEKHDVAREALLLLLATGDYYLCWKKWAMRGEEAGSAEDVDASAWQTPPEHRYLGLEQVDGATRRPL